MHNRDGSLDFVRQQRDIFRLQSQAIDRGDLVAAKTAGDQLNRSMSGLVQVVNLSRNGGSFTTSEKEDIEQLVAEMKSLRESAIDRLNTRRKHLSELLHEFRKGRQLLTRYQSGRKSGGRLFDITG